MITAEESQLSFPFPQALSADHGPPTLDVLSKFMTDIDQELAKQDRKIEETLEKLVEATNGLSSDNMYTNIKDAMDSLIHTSVLEECACLPPDSEDVNKLLKIIIEHISDHPGSEGMVFQQLLRLSFHEGMTLPVQVPKLADPDASSTPSLNTISDTMELENDSLWEDLRGRIRKYFLEQIQLIGSDELYASPTRRVRLVQSLSVLYPASEVWSGYESLRAHQVHQVIREKLRGGTREAVGEESLSDSPSLTDISERLPPLAVTLKALMKEDFHLFLFGVFGGVIDLKMALWKIYITKLNEELQAKLDRIASKKVDNSRIANGHPATPVQEPGEVVSMTSFDENQKQPLAPFPLAEEESEMVLSIVGTLSMLNDFYKSLCYQASWDTTLAYKLPAKGKGLLKGVLKPSKESSNSNGSNTPHDFKKRGVLPDAIPPPFGATPSMISESSQSVPSSDIVLQTPTSQRNKWNWFYLLEKFIPGLIESSLERMKQSISRHMSEENSLWRDQNSLGSVLLALDGVDEDIFADCQDCTVTKSTLSLLSSLSRLRPLDALWSELPMRYFRSVLANSSKECFQLLHAHLAKKLEDFVVQRASSKVVISVRELYAILASVSAALKWVTRSDLWGSEDDSEFEERKLEDFVIQLASSKVVISVRELYAILASVSSALKWVTRSDLWGSEEDSEGKSSASVVEPFEALQSTLVSEIEGYHNHLIQFVILQDAASHHWEDQKPFFEGERCSYSLQMWNLHMERLRGEMWSCCPALEAVRLFSGVLESSLQFLSQRYSRAMPSYRRTEQFRCDILFILSATLEHLFAAADSVQKVLPRSYSIQAHPLSRVHSPCTNLLAPLAVVAAPLPDLYKIFKKGFGQRQRFREDKDPDPSWMGWVWPELFERYQSVSEMPDSSAVFIVVSLIKKQRTFNYPLLLQALLMRSSLLPSLMAREIGRSRLNVPRYDGAPVKFEEFTEEEQQLFTTMTRLLAVCSDFPKSLGSFLLALVEREYSYSGSKVQESLYPAEGPLWMKCILGLLVPCFIRCLTEAAGLLEGDCHQASSPPGFLENLRQLPCGCRIRSKGQMLQEKDPDKVVLDACKLFIFTLSSEVMSLPASFCVFVQDLDKLLPDDGSTREQSLGLKLLTQILFLFLKDEAQVRGHLHDRLPNKIFKSLCQIGRLACMLLLGQTLDNIDVPPDLYHEFQRQHGDWLKESADKLADHFRKKDTHHHQDKALEETTLDYQEEYYRMLRHSVASFPEVMSGLPMVYNAVADNAEWIRSIMEIPQMPLFLVPEQPVEFKFRGRGSDRERPFNGIQQVNRIGDNTFTFQGLSELALDWKELLQSEIGLTKTSFQLLLSHRHDMQEGAHLEESEKKPVRVLRAKYNLEKADFV